MKLDIKRLRHAASLILVEGIPSTETRIATLRHAKRLVEDNPKSSLRSSYLAVTVAAQGESMTQIPYQGPEPHNVSVQFAVKRAGTLALDHDVAYALDAIERCGSFTDPTRLTPTGRAAQMNLLDIVRLQEEAEHESRRLLSLLEGIELPEAHAARQ